MATPAMIEMQSVEFGYAPSATGDGAFELMVPELRIGSGERVAVIGPSGCGKTTLVNLACGLCVPRAGVVRIAGEEVSAMGERARRRLRARRVGLVFQEFELLEYLNALENILLPFLIGEGMSPTREARRRAESLAAAVGIGHALRRRPQQLSQGERQRVAICRALVATPDVIVCDEPTGNLDPTTRGAVLDELLARCSEGRTLVMVTHDHSTLSRFDRVIDAGRLERRVFPEEERR